MEDDRYLTEFPGQDAPKGTRKPENRSPEPQQPAPTSAEPKEPDQAEAPARRTRFQQMWEGISRAGLTEITLRLGTHVLLVALILIVGWGLRSFYNQSQAPGAPAREAALAAALPTATPTPLPPQLPPYTFDPSPVNGIYRLVSLHTDVPSRPRMDVITYTVQTGDTVFDIAEKFGLKPETILWGNYFTLRDDPHNLRPGVELNILPVNGTYHRWSEGDGLNGVAKFFGVQPEDIVEFPGNHLNPDTLGDWSNPNIEAGTWLIIPGGTREFVTWSAPEIPRSNPGSAKFLGSGACGTAVDGAVGSGGFIWPSNAHFLSGFDYNPGANHRGIDIDGETGDPVYAVDNGVIVYAGWNDWGYGNMIVINHGNGWQTLYAHLSALYVGCGQSVYQGTGIGAIGSTGNSTGSHLHFEMMYNAVKVNPHDYLP